MCRCKHTHVDVACPGRSDPLNLAILKDPKKSCLGGWRQFSRLIEKHRSFMGGFKEPGSHLICPVNAPRSWPNNSLSIRVSDTEAQLMAIKGLCALRLLRWIARATSSLPVPVSPVIRTVVSFGATLAIVSRIAQMLSLSPKISCGPSSCSTAVLRTAFSRRERSAFAGAPYSASDSIWDKRLDKKIEGPFPHAFDCEFQCAHRG